MEDDQDIKTIWIRLYEAGNTASGYKLVYHDGTRWHSAYFSSEIKKDTRGREYYIAPITINYYVKDND